jgi:hypothetical protein
VKNKRQAGEEKKTFSKSDWLVNYDCLELINTYYSNEDRNLHLYTLNREVCDRIANTFPGYLIVLCMTIPLFA